MTEPQADAAATTTESTATAGAMIRAARERRGLHIAALAASIKVPQRKLEALEADRYDELLDLTFVRALAQTVCRTLKIDAQPVLDRLPQPPGHAPKLAHVSTGLATPFREGEADAGEGEGSWLGRPVVWGTLLVLACAAFVAFAPDHLLSRLRGAAAPAPPLPSASSVLPAPATVPPAPAASPVSDATPVLPATGVTPVASTTPAAATLGAPESAETPATTASAALRPPGSALLALKTSSESWIEVQDARGQTLLSRRVAAGESLGLDGDVPLRLTIGNASGTQITFRGKMVDLSANTVANVARLQLD